MLILRKRAMLLLYGTAYLYAIRGYYNFIRQQALTGSSCNDFYLACLIFGCFSLVGEAYFSAFFYLMLFVFYFKIKGWLNVKLGESNPELSRLEILIKPYQASQRGASKS